MGKFNLGKMVEGPAYAVLNEIFSEFRSDDGVAIPSRYEVLLHPPTGVRGTGAGDLSNVFSKQMGEMQGNGSVRKTSLRVSQIGFPGRALDMTADTNIYGPVRNIATGYTYGTLSSVIQCSNDMREKNFIDTWQRLAYNPQTWAMGYYNDYVGSMDIYLLDQDDKRRYGVQLVECFPSDMGMQSLDYTPAGDIITLPVTWSYRYWKNLTDEADLPKPLQDRIIEILSNTVERKITASIPKVLSRL
jgi:hypothetical protein